MSPDPVRPVVSRRGLRLAALAGAVLVVVIVAQGITTRRMADARLSDWTENQAVPVVAVAAPDTRGKPTAIDLPGRLEAYSQAQLYARVSGYLKDWKADIGTPVRAGQLIAEIDAPDLDQQIMQAEADDMARRPAGLGGIGYRRCRGPGQRDSDSEWTFAADRAASADQIGTILRNRARGRSILRARRT